MNFHDFSSYSGYSIINADRHFFLNVIEVSGYSHKEPFLADEAIKLKTQKILCNSIFKYKQLNMYFFKLF